MWWGMQKKRFGGKCGIYIAISLFFLMLSQSLNHSASTLIVFTFIFTQSDLVEWAIVVHGMYESSWFNWFILEWLDKLVFSQDVGL